MAQRIIGIQRISGEYEGHKYDKWTFHCIDEERSAQAFAGEVTSTFKVKVSTMGDVFGGVIKNDADLRGLIGTRVLVMYDQYRNPQRIELLGD